MVRISIIWKLRSFVVATDSQIVSVTLCKNRSIKADQPASLTINNSLDLGAATIFPTRHYRVQLVP